MKATQLILLFSIGVLIIPGSTGWMFRRKKSSSSSEESGESKTNSGSYESESDEEDQNDGYQDPTKGTQISTGSKFLSWSVFTFHFLGVFCLFNYSL